MPATSTPPRLLKPLSCHNFQACACTNISFQSLSILVRLHNPLLSPQLYSLNLAQLFNQSRCMRYMAFTQKKLKNVTGSMVISYN